MPERDLNARILAAHAADDRAALVSLYAQAADAAQSEDAEAFFLTYAYIYGLEMNHALTATLHARLVAMGREA